MIENFNEKIKNWQEIQQRIYEIFFIYMNLHEKKNPGEFIELGYAEWHGDDLYIEYSRYKDNDNVPEIYSFLVPQDYFIGERSNKELKEFFNTFTLTSNDIINRF